MSGGRRWVSDEWVRTLAAVVVGRRLGGRCGRLEPKGTTRGTTANTEIGSGRPEGLHNGGIEVAAELTLTAPMAEINSGRELLGLGGGLDAKRSRWRVS